MPVTLCVTGFLFIQHIARKRNHRLWKKPGVYNIEEFDPDPFMDALNKWGLPWHETFNPELVD